MTDMEAQDGSADVFVGKSLLRSALVSVAVKRGVADVCNALLHPN